MKFDEFVETFSEPRTKRYFNACKEDENCTISLYLLNLNLSKEFYSILSCFEIALRNKIDVLYTNLFGENWLDYCSKDIKRFNNPECINTKRIIDSTINNLGIKYSHNKLVAELGFGFWRYLFASNQFRNCNQELLKIFPSKSKSSKQLQYNNVYVFKSLAKVNILRNRIAHHEPICFEKNSIVISTKETESIYEIIKQLLKWMNIKYEEFFDNSEKINLIIKNINYIKTEI